MEGAVQCEQPFFLCFELVKSLFSHAFSYLLCGCYSCGNSFFP